MPVFSNISYCLRTKFTFIYLSFKFVWGGLRPLKHLEIQKRKIYYLLKFCQMMPQKSNFQTVLMIKGLAMWKRCNLNLILAYLAIAENLADFVVCNWVLGLFNPFWV